MNPTRRAIHFPIGGAARKRAGTRTLDLAGTIDPFRLLNNMNTPFTGGCICGAVRYECSARPEEIQMLKCHCRDCQRVSGGPYTPVVYVPAQTFRVTRGTIRHFNTMSEAGGPHQRGFCGDCGSRLTGGQREGSTGIGMTASSLDDPGWFKPGVDMWVSDAQPWDLMEPALPKFPKYPPR